MKLARKGSVILSVELIAIVLTIVLGWMAISAGLISQATALVIFAIVVLAGLIAERRYVDWS